MGVAAAQAVCRGRPDRGGMHGTRRAHPKHVTHGCDAGRVKTQRLVERSRALPRVEAEGQSRM